MNAQVSLRPRTVGILGGMGPAAGTDFARQFVRACELLLKARGKPVNDQAFPEHWLAQVPVPDRTAALLDGGSPPLGEMIAVLRRLSALGAKAVAIACNTAHAWHPEMQRSCPELELLHIVKETTLQLTQEQVPAVGLMATLGTHRVGLYEATLSRAGVRCHAPRPEEQALVMLGIQEGVKAGNLVLARDCFERVAQQLATRHGVSTILLACTEIPLALKSVPGHAGVHLLNPAQVLARALAERAYAPVPAMT